MANIMSQVKFSNKTSRNAFDLSHKVGFTSKAGELLPVYVEEVIPGDKFKISPTWFTRTEPLNTAAYTRLTEYIDFYFVPLRCLWRYSDRFFAQTNFNQSATSINPTLIPQFSQHPYMYLSDVCQYILDKRNKFSSNPADAANIFGFSVAEQTLKLLEYLGYGNLEEYFTDDGLVQYNINYQLNPFPLLAYQCIYQYFERNQQWENMRSDFFNVDYLNTPANLLLPVDTLTSSSSVDNLFTLRYANWKKDLFTGLLPKAQYGDEATATVINNTTQLNGRLVQSSPVNVTDDSGNTQQVIKQNSLGIYYLANNTGQNSPLNGNLPIIALRQAEAMQRYKEIKQSNKYDYKSQIEAIWDVNVSNERANMPRRIGGLVNGINIDEVVNTSITDNGTERQAANIAGKGAGAGKGIIEASFNEHGIVMGIYKVVPELDYLPLGLSRFHSRTNYTDYANPLFDKLGMESVKGSELIQVIPYDYEEDIPQEVLTEPLGYAPRYYDYKTAIDRVIGGFATSYLDTWVAPYSKETLLNMLYESYTTSRKLLNFGFFKINPMVLNSIFVSQINATEQNPYYYNADYTNEQFKSNMFFEVTAVRNLDYNGLPY